MTTGGVVFLLKIATALHEKKLPYAIVGGFAMVLHGAVRGTVDLDLVIQLKRSDFLLIEEIFLSIGLKSRLPVSADSVFQFRQEYISNRNLIAWSFYNESRPYELVDIILTTDFRNIRTVKKSFAGQKLTVISIPDLIKMKTEAARPQDLADVEALNLLLKIK
jgi:hypothetical protein